MKGSIFLDTNILIYSWNSTSPEKQSRANKILANGHTVISWQVIQEFCNVATRKFKPAMPVSDLERYVLTYLEPMCVVLPSRRIWSKTLWVHAQTQYAFYDSLIVASAILAGSDVLFSEDLQHGRRLEGLEIRNPFLENPLES
jgi:predicted nucleic acid-binding protein